MVSVLANSYDRYAKLLNGTHKSHVHSEEEVSLSLSLITSPSTPHHNHVFIILNFIWWLLVYAGWYPEKVQAYYQLHEVDYWS